MKNPIQLGARVQDIITGLEGVVTARIEYITGCEQCGVTPAAKEGKMADTIYLDYTRLKVVGDAVILAGRPLHTEAPGGPQRDAPR